MRPSRFSSYVQTHLVSGRTLRQLRGDAMETVAASDEDALQDVAASAFIELGSFWLERDYAPKRSDFPGAARTMADDSCYCLIVGFQRRSGHTSREKPLFLANYDDAIMRRRGRPNTHQVVTFIARPRDAARYFRVLEHASSWSDARNGPTRRPQAQPSMVGSCAA